MKEQNISRAYAKAIVFLAEEVKVDLASEITNFNVCINSNNSLENVLFSDVFTIEEKLNVAKEILKRIKVSPITQNFVSFLIGEKRMGIFPLIFKEIIVLDDHKRGFLKGVIEGSDIAPDPVFTEKLRKYLDNRTQAKTDLQYVKNNDVSAGYKVTVGDLQLDASLDNQLENFKDFVLSNNH
jgi:F-type H+-transporting ATPase subunit delta